MTDDERREVWLWDTYAAERQRDEAYHAWCVERELDPELGDTARKYEEEWAGEPIEQWWDAMEEAAREEARQLMGDGGAVL